jgi:hypothetical protein
MRGRLSSSDEKPGSTGTSPRPRRRWAKPTRPRRRRHPPSPNPPTGRSSNDPHRPCGHRGERRADRVPRGPDPLVSGSRHAIATPHVEVVPRADQSVPLHQGVDLAPGRAGDFGPADRRPALVGSRVADAHVRRIAARHGPSHCADLAREPGSDPRPRRDVVADPQLICPHGSGLTPAQMTGASPGRPRCPVGGDGDERFPPDASASTGAKCAAARDDLGH